MTFFTFNQCPNPTQMVDWMEGFSLIYLGLATDTSPARLELKDISGLTFEIVP